jgi:crotonobetainyl-CoA:carnitine CoA-transferase CaiB-like acyl-CoA transferase
MTQPGSSQLPLAGVRVLDMTSVVAGPYATQIIADLGADVIKVEGKDGDLMRTAGPARHRDMAVLYLGINRNKRSIALDLKSPRALPLMHELIASVDVFVTNVRPQGMARLGLDYEAVRKVKPEIIYVHLVGFGEGGAYAGRQAFDDLVQAASGVADLLPRTDGGGPPRFMPSLLADKATGLHAVYGMLAALFQRERTGEGQFVEVPMLESVASFTLVEHLYGYTHVPASGPWGYTRVLTPHRRPFQTQDSYIAIMPYTDQQWPRFFELAGRSDLWQQWRDTSRQDRNKRIAELYALIGELTQTRTTAEWMELLDAHDIPCMRVNTLEDLPHDPHLKQAGFFEEHQHPTEDRYVSLKPPVKFSNSQSSLRRHPPRLGADAAEVLAEIGVSSADVDALIADGVLAVPPPDEP